MQNLRSATDAPPAAAVSGAVAAPQPATAAAAAAAPSALGAVSRMLQQAAEAEAAANAVAAAASDADMDVDVESGSSPSAAAADTLRVAALVLLLQLTHAAAQQQQHPAQSQAQTATAAAKPTPASAAAAAAAAAASAASAAVSAISTPLQSLLSSVASALPGSFFSRLLAAGTGQDAPRLPPGSLPSTSAAAADAAPQPPSYPELALRALRELAAHPNAARALAAAQPAGTNAVVGLLAWLHELHVESTGTGGVVSPAKGGAASPAVPLSESQLALVEQAVLALDRLAQGAAATPTHAEQPAPVVPLLHLQPLVALLPLLPHAVPSVEATPLEAATVRALAWLLPPTLAAAPPSQAAIAVRHLVPPLAGLFERDQTPLKLAYLRLLCALQDSASATRTQADGGMLPPPLHLLSLRQGVETMLGSKVDLPVRIMLLKLARMLLQQYGPVWATVPAPAAAASAAGASPSVAAAAARASSSTSAAVSGPPHCRFLQLLYNISTVELRMTLMESASPRPADMQRMAGESGRLRVEGLREALALLMFLLGALVGEDGGVSRESRPFQWWNLSGDMLMFFKGKMDESAEAILTFFRELSERPSHPRSREVVWWCVRALSQWLAEDCDACERGDVHAALPFMLAAQPPAPADATAAAPASSAEPQSVLALMLPALLFLCTNADALDVLRSQRLAPRLVSELILPEYSAGIERQLSLLSEAAQTQDGADGVSARDRQEIREALLLHVGASLAAVGNACTVLCSLCSGGSGGGAGPAESIELVRPLWTQLKPVVNSCLKIANDPSLSSDWDLDVAVAGMAAVADLLARKLDRGGK